MREGKYVILLVDDDQDVVDTLRLTLEASDYIVVEADSAEEGLRRFRAESPDLIIVDLMMEEVDSGASIVKELRLLGSTAPVYLLSAVGDALHSNIPYSDLGFAGVFQKPVDTRALIETLERQLNER